MLRRSVQRVVGNHLRDLAPGQHSFEERRSGGEPLATLCWVRPTRESSLRPSAPITNCLATDLTQVLTFIFSLTRTNGHRQLPKIETPKHNSKISNGNTDLLKVCWKCIVISLLRQTHISVYEDHGMDIVHASRGITMPTSGPSITPKGVATWRAADDTVSDITGSVIEPWSCRTVTTTPTSRPFCC